MLQRSCSEAPFGRAHFSKFLVTSHKALQPLIIINSGQENFVDLVCQVLSRRCHDSTRVHFVRAPVREGEGLSAPFG